MVPVLLSSIGESHNCLKPKVKKLPYSLDAQNYSFDITTQQPQLFVTPDFKHLNTVLEQYLDTMAVRKGGMESLKKALQFRMQHVLWFIVQDCRFRENW